VLSRQVRVRHEAFWVLWAAGVSVLAILCYAVLGKPAPGRGETLCRKCGSVLRGIGEPRCPECGERI
jgi:hypothetical protein